MATRRTDSQKLRTRVCEVCHRPFCYEVSRGTDRKHCSSACRQIRKKEFLAHRKANPVPCDVPLCGKPSRGRSHGLCEMHYGRRRRNVSDEAKPLKEFYETKAGYRKLLRKGHALSDSSGQVFEHRYVLHAARPVGPYGCFWCGKVLDWDTLVVDHLNENKSDNRLENLVCSCNRCNRARGAILPFLRDLTDEALTWFVCQAVSYRDNYRTVGSNLNENDSHPEPERNVKMT